MRTTPLLPSIALLAVTISAPLLLAGCAQQADPTRIAQQNGAPAGNSDVFDYRMQPVPNDAGASAPGYGWRYFTDVSEPRAVVISPQGDYYFSRGEGLSWVAARQF